jgi:hypothetical protein
VRPSELDSSFTLRSVARHPLRFFAALGLGTLWYIVVPTIAAAAVFTAVLSDAANVFSSGNLLLSGTTPTSVLCTSSGPTISSDAATCTGNPLPSATLSTTAFSATSTLASRGTVSASSALVYSTGCGVAQFTDSTSGADTALPDLGVTYATPMSALASTAAAFDGSTGWVETLKSVTNPENFTIAGWFNSSVAQGTLIGFSSVQTTAGSTSNDRELWLDSAGKLVWATTTSSSAITELTSPTAYNNGAWHFVVATIGTTNNDQLYVDGVLVASSTTSAAYSYTGYWTLGWGSEETATPAWTDKPTSAYFKGSLAGFAIIPSQLSTAQVTALYATKTMSTFSAAITALTPTSYWPLNDSGSVPYTGALPSQAATTLKFYDASGHADTASPGTGTITAAASGPLGGTAVTLAGITGSAINAATSLTSPQTFSQSIWFKTTASGVLMGLTNVAADTTASTSHDHMLWIDPAGKLVYGIDYGTTPANTEMTSTGTYNNGSWHLGVITGSAAGTSMYVDGALVASSTTALTVTSYTGYWHLGYGYATGWSDAPSANYFTGSLAHAAYFTTALSAAQVTSLFAASTTATEENAVLALSPSGYWPLYDTLTSPACATVEVTIGALKGSTTSCVEPYAAASACAAPATTVEANTVLPKTVPQPVSGTSVALTFTLKLTGAEPTGVAGLHLLIPLIFMTQYSSFSSQLSYATAQAVL